MSDNELLEAIYAVEARRVVTAGAELLDQARPGWAEMVDLENLNMLSPWMCILGQVFGPEDRNYASGYGRGLEVLWPDDPIGVDDSAYGFNSGWSSIEAITDAWGDAVRERLTQV
jgi:hypothetical protein